MIRPVRGSLSWIAILAITGLLQVEAPNTAYAQQTQYFQYPVYGNGNYIIQDMTFDTYAKAPKKWHTGWDIANSYSASPYIMASAYGKIWKIVNNNTWVNHDEGNSVIILHYVPNGMGGVMKIYTQYDHMARFASGIYEGMPVEAGTILGVMGGSGGGSASMYSRHLHFEVKHDGEHGGELQNPWNYPWNDSYPYWGYVKSYPTNYGWLYPGDVLGHWQAIKF